MKRTHELGMVHPVFVTAVGLSITTVVLAVFGVWAFLNYQDQKNNVDAKVAAAVADAKRAQSEADQVTFAEQEKQPTRKITGPTDLGQVTFAYPKTWSVYIDHDGAGNSYEAYFYPQVVPPLTSNTPYALRTSIVNNKYESVLAGFSDRTKTGALKASPITVAGVDGMRLDGAFTNAVRGSMVLFKIRDKTLEVYTQAESFKGDFDSIVLKSLEFNK
jgi:hypothetical protein